MDQARRLTFTATDALRFGWDKTRENLKPLLILGAVGAFLSLLHGALGEHGLLRVAVQLLQVALSLAYVRVALRLHDDRPFDLSRPTELLSGFLSFLLVSVLYAVLVGVGFMLLIVPGVYLALRYGCAPYLVADRRLDPLAALTESTRLTEGVRLELLSFLLLALLANFVGALAFGVGLLVTVPTTVIAGAYVYRRLTERSDATPPVAAAAPHPDPATP